MKRYEKILNFRDLEIWRLGMEISRDVYKLSKCFPKDELYGLTSQMKRAAVSIPSNIAEGFNRRYIIKSIVIGDTNRACKRLTVYY